MFNLHKKPFYYFSALNFKEFMIDLKYLLTFVFLIFLNSFSRAQTDTIIMNDNNVLTGKIKSMENGVLKIKTSYSKKDFEAEWLKVKVISSRKNFRFTLTDGSLMFGFITKDSASNYLMIHDSGNGNKNVSPEDIVSIKRIDKGGFFDVANLSFDLGYSFTKANNLQQINSTLNGDYYSKFWGIYMSFNTVQSSRDSVEPTRRTNGNTGFRYFFIKDVFAAINADYNSNSEQGLKLRSNYNLTIGKYFLHTNKVFFNSAFGVASNTENYKDKTNNRSSVEGIASLELNIFDIGDLNLYSNMIFYPSFTEKYRLRTDLNFNLKYKLPRDFYIKTGLDYKYDTKPVEGVIPEDYVVTAGIGWEL